MKYFFAILLFFLIFRLGFFYLFPIKLINGQRVNFSTTLFDDPKTIGNYQLFFVRLGNFWNSTKVQIITHSNQDFSYGQTINVIGTLKEKSLKNKQAYFAIQNPQIEAKNNGFLSFFGTFRGKIITFCENNFSQPYSGLLVGIIFGIKSLLTDQIIRSFRITGVSHIVAASGMNVTLVAGFLFGLLGSFLRRRWATGISIAGIFAYTALAGFDASIVRAALMGTLAFSAGFFGRQYSGVYVLMLVSLIMLLWDPLLLLDVGFQLSVLATAGILLLKSSLFSANIIGDDLGTTLAAQIATLPVLLSVFGQYSLLSILANLLVLWTIPLIMIIGGVGIFVGLFFQPVGTFIVWLSIPLLWYLTSVTTFFSAHAVLVQIQSVPIFFIVGYYGLVFAIVLFIQKKGKP